MRVGIEEEEVGASEERKWSMSGEERQRREVDRGRGRGGGGVVEKEKREVDRGRGGRGETGVKRGKREVNYGLQDVDRSLAGSSVERAKGVEKGEARAE